MKFYSDPLTEAICQAVDALAVALGDPDPVRRARALADAARWTAAAQAAHAAVLAAHEAHDAPAP